MTNKVQAILRDMLGILFCGLYAGWSFSLINHSALLLQQPFLLVPLMFIRPCVAYDNKVKKIIGAILVLIFFVMAITVFVGYFIMGIKSADSSLWPFGLKLTFGLCFLILVIIGLYKLLQDMKIPEEDGR